MFKFLDAVDSTVKWIAYIGAILLLPLIIAMLTEVISRYVFDAPTLWAYETAYMLTGSFFLMGIGYTLQVGGT